MGEEVVVGQGNEEAVVADAPKTILTENLPDDNADAEATEGGDAEAVEGSEDNASTADTDAEGTGEETDHSKDGTDDDATDSDKQADDDKGGETSVEYEAFTLPDGMEMDAAALEAVTPVLKEMGATQEQAQKLVDIQVKTISDIYEGQQKAWADTQSGWVDQGKADKEYGGDKYDESVVLAQKGLLALGTSEFIQALDDTGFGNHPEMIRMLVKVGEAVGEDNLTFGKANAEKPKTAAQKIFSKYQNAE